MKLAPNLLTVSYGFGIGCGLHIGVPDVCVHVACAVLFDGG